MAVEWAAHHFLSVRSGTLPPPFVRHRRTFTAVAENRKRAKPEQLWPPGCPGGFQHDARLPDQAVQSFGHKLGLIYIFSDGMKRNLFSLLLFFWAGGVTSS